MKGGEPSKKTKRKGKLRKKKESGKVSHHLQEKQKKIKNSAQRALAVGVGLQKNGENFERETRKNLTQSLHATRLIQMESQKRKKNYPK